MVGVDATGVATVATVKATTSGDPSRVEGSAVGTASNKRAYSPAGREVVMLIDPVPVIPSGRIPFSPVEVD